MIKKGLALLLSMTVVLGSFASCGSNNGNNKNDGNNKTNQTDNGDKGDGGDKTDGSPKQIVWNIGADPKYLDPGLNSASDGGDVINNMFEGLLREDEKGAYQPAIAESWEMSEDGKVYTFKLKDTKWSDGTPLTAKDFEYSWKRALNPDTKSEYAFIMAPILNANEYSAGEASAEEVGIKAIDDKTLEVTLKAPTAYFLGLTTFYTFFPVKQDIVEANEDGIWAKNGETAVSNGPFKLESYKTGDKLVLVKNDNYWNAENVKIDKIEGLMITEASTSYTAYKNDSIDVLNTVPNDLIPKLMIEDSEFIVKAMTGTYYYIFNLRADAPEAFKNAKVRKALGYAIDRKKITELVLKGGQIPATGFVPPGIQDADGNDFNKKAGDYGIKLDNSNAEMAKKLLAEAGYPEGKDFPEFVLKYNTSESHKKVAETVQAMWKDVLGINVKLENSEWAVFQDQRSNGEFDVARGGWIGDYSDPNTMLDLFIKGGSHNDPMWENEEYTKLIEEAAFKTGQDRMNMFYEAEKILMEEMPIIPVYYYSDFYMVKSKLMGVAKTKLNTFYFGNASME